MSGINYQYYVDDKNEGHVDTRESNFRCENPDTHLGWGR